MPGRQPSRKWSKHQTSTHWSTVTSKGRRVHIEFVPPQGDDAGDGTGPPSSSPTQVGDSGQVVSEEPAKGTPRNAQRPSTELCRRAGVLPPKKCCGLCNLPFAPENLPGVVTRKAIMRLRDAWAQVSRKTRPLAKATEQRPALQVATDNAKLRNRWRKSARLADARPKNSATRKLGDPTTKPRPWLAPPTNKVRTTKAQQLRRKQAEEQFVGLGWERDTGGSVTRYVAKKYRAPAAPRMSRLYDEVHLCVFCAQMFPIDDTAESLREHKNQLQSPRTSQPVHPARTVPRRSPVVHVLVDRSKDGATPSSRAVGPDNFGGQASTPSQSKWLSTPAGPSSTLVGGMPLAVTIATGRGHPRHKRPNATPRPGRPPASMAHRKTKRRNPRRHGHRSVAAREIHRLKLASTLHRPRNPPVKRLPDPSVLVAANTPAAGAPRGPVSRDVPRRRPRRTQAHMRRLHARQKARSHNVSSNQYRKTFRQLRNSRPALPSSSTAVPASPLATVVGTASADVGGRRAHSHALPSTQDGVATGSTSATPGAPLPQESMRSFTTSPRMVPSAPIQVPGQGPGAQVGSIAENSRGTAELYSKSQVVVPESSRSPMAEGADTIRAEDVMHSQVDVQQAEAGLLTSESDLSVGSAGASEQAQARDSQSFVDVDELQTFGFSDFLKRVARPPSISDYRANLEQLLEESNEHHRLENMTPLPPQAVFEMPPSALQRFWPIVSLEPPATYRDAFTAQHEPDGLGPAPAEEAMAIGKVQSQTPATTQTYDGAGDRSGVVHRSQATFGRSLGVVTLPVSPCGNKPPRSGRLSTAYGFAGLVGAGGVAHGPYSPKDVTQRGVHRPPHLLSVGSMQSPYVRAMNAMPMSASVKANLREFQKQQQQQQEQQHRAGGVAAAADRSVASIVANWNELEPYQQRASGTVRFHAPPHTGPRKRGSKKVPVPPEGSSTSPQRSRRPNRRRHKRVIKRTFAPGSSDRKNLAPDNRGVASLGRATPPGLVMRVLAPADGAVVSEGVRRPVGPRSITPVLQPPVSEEVQPQESEWTELGDTWATQE